MFAKIALIYNTLKSVKEIINLLQGLYETYQDKKIDNHYKKKNERRTRLLKEIDANKDDDEKLIELNRKLTLLNSSK